MDAIAIHDITITGVMSQIILPNDGWLALHILNEKWIQTSGVGVSTITIHCERSTDENETKVNLANMYGLHNAARCLRDTIV